MADARGSAPSNGFQRAKLRRDGRRNQTLDSPAIDRAIQAAAAAGGGTVFIPAGTYLSGSIHLTNNIHL